MKKPIRTLEDNQISQLENEVTLLNKKIAKYEAIGLKQNRFGLVWLDVPEAFEYDVENKLPILKEVSKLAIRSKDNKPTHLLIEGDNYHALTCLNYTHKDKIDVIYIDPPYNTGSDGFKYKDKRILDKFPDGTEVPADHPLRHSYWLSFMKKRLELSRALLSEQGVIFVSIDENENAQLKLLMDEIFGSENFIASITVQSNPRGKQQMKIATTHEYLLVYGKNINKSQINSEELSNEQVGGYSKVDENNFNYRELGLRKRGAASRRVDVPNLYYPIYVNPKIGEVALKKDKIFTKEAFPILSNGEDGRWRWGKKKFEIDKNRLYGRLVNNQRWDIFERDYLIKDGEQKGIKSKSIWDEKELNYENAKKELKDLFDGKTLFDYPKTVYLIKKVCKIASNSNSIILDFFAGSGTTGQAVMELNEQDGGKRQFILITNNDEITNGEKHKIMTDICYPRIKKVINGYNSKQKLGNSAKYFKTAFVGKNNILKADDTDKIELAHNAGSMLAIAENTLYQVEQNNYWQIFESPKQYTAVYFREEFGKFDDFIKKVRKFKRPVVIYIFSWEKEFEFNEFEDDKNIKVKTIPQPILEIYKQIYNLI